MLNSARIARGIVIAAMAFSLAPTAQAQMGPPPPGVVMDAPPALAAARAKFENMTPEQVTAAGYMIDPVCVDAGEVGLPKELGGMGYHAVHPQVWGQEFRTGQWDPEKPGILLLNADKKVVGVEWEAASHHAAPVLFGQTAPLLPGHPGPPEVNVPHYMLHIYFRPGGKVLVDVWDPELKCPAAAIPTPRDVAPAAAAAAAAPASAPTPRDVATAPAAAAAAPPAPRAVAPTSQQMPGGSAPAPAQVPAGK
jgi:hypothetical protein